MMFLLYTGGKYFVTGGTDHIIRVYICIPGPPTLQAELEGQHTVRHNQLLCWHGLVLVSCFHFQEKIMTVQFGNTGEG